MRSLCLLLSRLHCWNADGPEVFSGFSDPNVVLIAALFIIGDGLVRTGVATVMGTWLVKVAGNSEIKMLVLLMLTVAGLARL